MKVVVNPNYRGSGWFDTAAKISFVKEKEYEVTEDMNLVHVKKHLALGYLLEVSKNEEVNTESISPIVTSSTKELLDEPVQDNIKEIKAEIEVVEECTSDETKKEKPKKPKSKSKGKSRVSEKADTEK